MTLTIRYGPYVWQDYEILDAITRWHEKHGRPPTGLDWRNAGFGHPSCVTVRDHFGTMAAAVQQAGLEARERIGGYESYWSKDRIAAAMLDELFRTSRWPTARGWAKPHGGPRTGGAERPCTGTVRRVFGTWGAAKVYAGYVPPAEQAERDRLKREKLDRFNAARRDRRVKRVPAASRSGLGGLSTGRDSSSSPRGGTNGGGTPSHKQTARRNRQVTTARSDDRSVAA